MLCMFDLVILAINVQDTGKARSFTERFSQVNQVHNVLEFMFTP